MTLKMQTHKVISKINYPCLLHSNPFTVGVAFFEMIYTLVIYLCPLLQQPYLHWFQLFLMYISLSCHICPCYATYSAIEYTMNPSISTQPDLQFHHRILFYLHLLCVLLPAFLECVCVNVLSPQPHNRQACFSCLLWAGSSFVCTGAVN